jgi:hypothetical protein
MAGKQKTLDMTQKTRGATAVECLGMTFESEEARRAHFLELLRQKLRDPNFRETPGFPVGTDESILSLSDPPYYTACPNPFVDRLLPPQPEPDDDYNVEPYAADLSESRSTTLYTAHSYHTKVPPRAIAKLILHYTKPGDVVLDAFCGSGMTGVACRLTSDASLAREVGGRAGPRQAVLCDLSPAATFIASVYGNPPSSERFDVCSGKGLDAAESTASAWWHVPGVQDGERIDYMVWIEQFVCPNCQRPLVSKLVGDATDDIGTASTFPCPHCSALVSKAPKKDGGSLRLVRQLELVQDPALGGPARRMKRVPLFVEVRAGRERRRIDVTADVAESLGREVSSSEDWFPTDPLILGERFRLKDCCEAYGVTHLHHFYLPRQLRTYARCWAIAESEANYADRALMKFFFSSNAPGMTVMNRFAPNHHSQVNRTFSGTLYIGSTVAETTLAYTYKNKRERLVKAFGELEQLRAIRPIITTQSSTSLSMIPTESVDYIFVDPPFGKNLQYSELNQLWEGWLAVKTQRDHEAVMDETRQRGIREYSRLMSESFSAMYRVLKPGRWISIEFHNSSSAVWHALQEALLHAGFVVSDVRVLDKEADTYKQAMQGLVKRDLVVSAYKPSHVLVSRLLSLGGATAMDGWAFIREHLGFVSMPKAVHDDIETVEERAPQSLFDRLVGFFVQREVIVPLSFPEFLEGLSSRVVMRDGMCFLPEQAQRYDRLRAKCGRVLQLSLFVNDELSAVRWLRNELERKPQTFQELHPEYTKAARGWAKHERSIDLLDVLRENFVCFESGEPIPARIVSWLRQSQSWRTKLDLLGIAAAQEAHTKDSELIRAAKDRWYVPNPAQMADMEKVRHRNLMKEFQTYREGTERKIKQFRTEAVRAGFKAAYDARDYRTIVEVAAKLPDEVVQEDDKLLMYLDVAMMRVDAAAHPTLFDLGNR